MNPPTPSTHLPPPPLLPRSALRLGAWLASAVLSAAACGRTDETDMGQQQRAGASGIGGSLGFAGNAGGGATANAPSGPPCGATPCANYTGSKTFVEPGAPQDAADTFDQGTLHEPGSDATREPGIVYPAHETMFPINVSHIRHEWSAAGNDLFRLIFRGPSTTVTIYTGAASWTPSDEQWDWIAESNRGSPVELEVAGLDTTLPADVWAAAGITELFSDAAVDGAIYYWSTGTKGIMRARISDPIPEKFIPIRPRRTRSNAWRATPCRATGRASRSATTANCCGKSACRSAS